MSSTEPKAYDIMTSLDVDYVLVIFGGLIGYSGDDINKFLWMVRIAEGEHPQDIRVRKFRYLIFRLSCLKMISYKSNFTFRHNRKRIILRRRENTEWMKKLLKLC